jgi:hypothetical protein
MDRIECSVWSNGGTGWGFKVLGGPDVRKRNFSGNLGEVVLDLDGMKVFVNVDKRSFWNKKCGELIKKEIGDYVARHGLKANDRVWLEVVEPGSQFRVEPA